MSTALVLGYLPVATLWRIAGCGWHVRVSRREGALQRRASAQLVSG